MEVGRTIVGLGHLLSRCWENAEYRNQRKEGIWDQELDKTALLLFQAWTGPKPFLLVPGWHGQGPAVRSSKKGQHVFIGRVISLFQQRFKKHVRIFSIDQSSGPWTYFKPLLRPTDWDRWTKNTPTGQELGPFVEEFAAIMTRLTPKEVIAFGRHISPGDTAAALGYLMTRNHAQLQSFERECLDPGNGWKHLREAYETARSAADKVTTDRKLYRDARSEVIKPPETSARDAILACRPFSDQDIWEYDPVKNGYAPKATQRYSFVRLLRVGFHVWAEKTGRHLDGRPLDRSPEAEVQEATVQWRHESNSFDVENLMRQLVAGEFVSLKQELRRVLETLS